MRLSKSVGSGRNTPKSGFCTSITPFYWCGNKVHMHSSFSIFHNEFPFSFLLGLYSIKWNPLIYCAYMCEYVCGEQRTTFKRNLFFCFLSCGSHKLIKVKPGSKHLHPLRHLTNLFVSIFLIEIYTKKKRNKSFRNILLCFVWEFLRHSLIMWPRLIWNWWSSFLSFPNPEIMNIYFWD